MIPSPHHTGSGPLLVELPLEATLRMAATQAAVPGALTADVRVLQSQVKEPHVAPGVVGLG